MNKDYSSSFDHANEKVSPGYHKLHLGRYDIGVEFTSPKG